MARDISESVGLRTIDTVWATQCEQRHIPMHHYVVRCLCFKILNVVVCISFVFNFFFFFGDLIVLTHSEETGIEASPEEMHTVLCVCVFRCLFFEFRSLFTKFCCQNSLLSFSAALIKHFDQ